MKRNIYSKWVVSLLAIILCLCMFSRPIYAAEETKDGIVVTLTTDETEYEKGEKIVATLTVKNTNDRAIYNVSMETLIPDGYVPDKGAESLMQKQVLAAGEEVNIAVQYVPDTAPETGDGANGAIWAIILVVSATGLVAVTIKSKKWRRVLSLVLCVALITPSFNVLAAQGTETEASDNQNEFDEEDVGRIDIATNVKVGDKEVTVKGIVKYTFKQTALNFDTFYKVNFDYPDGTTEDEQNSIFFADEQLVCEGTLVYVMPEPYSQSYMFTGWYYDSKLTKEAGPEDVITADTTLYPRMVKNTEAIDGFVTNNYVSDLDVTDLDKYIVVKAPSRQAVLDGLVFVEATGNGEELEFNVTDNGDGTYKVKPKDSLKGGKSYQFRANDREQIVVTDRTEDLRDSYIRFLYNGEVQSTDVCYYNIFTSREQVNNLKLNSGLEFISINNTQGLNMDASSSLYSVRAGEDGQMDIENNQVEGTFIYNGSKPLAVGDVIAIYEGDSSVEEEYANNRTAANAKNTAFVEILAINGNEYTYHSAKIEDVLYIPDVLPIARENDEDGNADNNSITVDNQYLDYKSFPVESLLDEDTVVEVGDFVALYEGVIENPENIAYGKVTEVTYSGTKTIIEFESATIEDINTSIDSYIYNSIPVELDDAEQVELENAIVEQGIESGFAEEAAAFAVRERLGMSETPVWNEAYSLTREQASTLGVEIESGEIDAGTFVYMLRFDPPEVRANITSSLQKITTINSGNGIRVSFGVYIPIGIEVVNIFTNEVDESLNMDLYVTFEQEFAFDISAEVDFDVELFLGFIPIDMDLVISASFDVGTYTGVGAVVVVDTQKNYDKSYIWDELVDNDGSNGAFTSSKSLAEQLNDMLEDGNTSFFDQYKDEDGNSTLLEEYRQMLSNEVDYVDILAIPLYKFKGYITPTTPIVQYLVEPELVFAAKLNVMLGTSLESLNVKQFGFTLDVFEGKAWAHEIIDKQTPYHNFNLLMLGNIGFRAGVRVTASLGLLSLKLANIGLMIELGIYADLYGFGYYHYDWAGTRTDGKNNPNIQNAGAFYLEIGFYMDLDIFAGAFMDLVSINIHLLEMQIPIFKLGTRNYIYDVELPQSEYSQGDYFRLPEYMYRASSFDVKTGDISTYTLNKSNFTAVIPDEYKDIIKFDEYTYDGRLSHFFYFIHDRKKLEETAKVEIVYKPSIQSARSASMDSLYDLIGEASDTLTINWSREKKKYNINYNSLPPVYEYNDTYISTYHPSKYVRVASVVEGDTIPVFNDINSKAPELEGFEFSGWRVSCYDDEQLNNMVIKDISELAGYKMPLCDINLYPLYVARDDTKFTVRHLLPSLENPEEYEVFQEEVHFGTSASIAGSKLEYYIYQHGISVDYSKLPILKAYTNDKGEVIYIQFGERIRHDGSTVMDLYYTRDDYKVTVHANNPDYVYYGTEASSYTTEVKYGEAVVDPGYAETEIPGYTFAGWSTSADGSSGIMEELPASLDAVSRNSTIDYYAIWQPEEVEAYVRYYLINAYGEYKLIGEEEKEYLYGTKLSYIDVEPNSISIPEMAYVSKMEASIYTNNDKQIYGRDHIYYADGNLNIDVYYTIGYSKVTIDKEESYRMYGDIITLPQAEKQGYVFDGWKSVYEGGIKYKAGETVEVKQSIYCFIPEFVVADDTPYVVEHYLQDINGEYPDEPTETETLYGTTESYVSPETNTYTGFVTPATKKVKIEADGSTIVQYFYDREIYEVSVDFEIDGEDLILRGQYKHSYSYGSPFYFTDVDYNPVYINREGYRIVSWYLADDELNPDKTPLDPESYRVSGDVLTSQKNLVFKPIWEKVPCEYHVEHYLEQLDGSFTLQQTDKKTATINDVVEATPMEFAGFTLDEDMEGTVTSATITSTSNIPVLKLYYTRNSYEVKWYSYDGKTVLATTDVLYQDSAVPPTSYSEDNSRVGYTLIGWKDMDYGKVTKGGMSFSTATYGDWTANSYTVRFDGGAGTGTMEDQDFDYDIEQQLSSNEFKNPGYVFIGWATESQGEVVYGNKELVKNLAASGTVTLYAVWELGDEYAYKVEHYTEELDGTYSLYHEEDFTALVDSVITAGQIAIDGFTYDADNANEVLSGTVDSSGSLVLKLYYTRDSYQLTFDFNGECLKQAVEVKNANNQSYKEVQTVEDEDVVITVKYGQTLSDITDVSGYFEGLIFAGYTFEGWYNGETLYDGSEEMPAEGLVLTAKWEPITITVTYHAGMDYLGGTTEATQLTYTYSYGDTITAPDVIFTSTSNDIAGWIFNDGSGGNGQYPTLSSWPLELVYGYHSSEYFISGNTLDLTPFWSNTYTVVTFNGNGGQGTMNLQYFDASAGAMMLSKNRFEREGYKFGGWNTAQDGSGTTYADLDYYMSQSNSYGATEVTLYAIWIK